MSRSMNCSQPLLGLPAGPSVVANALVQFVAPLVTTCALAHALLAGRIGQNTPAHVVQLPLYVPPAAVHCAVVWAPRQDPSSLQHAPVAAGQAPQLLITARRSAVLMVQSPLGSGEQSPGGRGPCGWPFWPQLLMISRRSAVLTTPFGAPGGATSAAQKQKLLTGNAHALPLRMNGMSP